MEVGMRFHRVALVGLLAAGVSAAASADAASRKYDWNPVNGIQETDVRDGDIVVSQVQFNLGSTLKGTPIRKSSADVKVRIDNNGTADEEVGVAVVVFDAEGNVVAAGSNGTKWGYLNKGDRTYYAIDFPYVYRRLDKAASFLVTVETRSKGKNSTSKTYKTTTNSTTETDAPAKAEKPAPDVTVVAEPAPKPQPKVEVEPLPKP
jgi:hypothetical protein